MPHKIYLLYYIMNTSNKESLLQFGKVVAMTVAGLIVIASNTAVWNACAAGVESGFIAGVAVVNFLLEGAGVFFVGRKWFRK